MMDPAAGLRCISSSKSNGPNHGNGLLARFRKERERVSKESQKKRDSGSGSLFSFFFDLLPLLADEEESEFRNDAVPSSTPCLFRHRRADLQSSQNRSFFTGSRPQKKRPIMGRVQTLVHMAQHMAQGTRHLGSS